MTVEAGKVSDRAQPTFTGRSTWWVQPVSVAVGFSLFVLYSFWSVVLSSGGHGWERGPYLSPFYSPMINISWFPFSSAILVAWVPLAFRGTCYYYRKAYYRAFFWDPPACAIGEPKFRKNYRGEQAFPWVFNNLHRFFLYLAIIVLAFLWIDTVRSFYYNGSIYVGVGSIIMLANVIFLTAYTSSCHALRHLVGGSVNCFSCVRGGKARRGMWGFVTKINPYHGTFAWFSLVSVGLTDVYIRLVSSGAFGCTFHGHVGC